MHSDVAISVKNLTKTYRIFGHPGDRIKQALTFGQKQFHKEFTALKDVSFEIKKGETVGIIGRNGSGKSTLLQLICGILKPTSGTVEVNGRISALLELGAGFNPEFTGRENVYFQGTLMGFSKEQMDEKFDEIAAFADIGDFIDQQVRTYSSGMFIRLAFAAASSVDPKIMVIDEALSVGDSVFQSRCLGKIRTLQEAGVVILLVSHSHNLIASLCNRALLLHQGRQIFLGSVNDAASRYESLCLRQPIKPKHFDREPDATNVAAHRLKMEILDVRVFSRGVSRFSEIARLEEISVWIRFRANKNVELPCFGISVRSYDGLILWSTTTIGISMDVHSLGYGETRTVKWECSLPLGCGRYVIAIGLGENVQGGYVRYDRLHDAGYIEVMANEGCLGSGVLSVSDAKVYETEWEAL